MAAKEILGKTRTISGDGTRLTGFVTAKENKPPRECGHCEYMKGGSCHNKYVMKDLKVPNRVKRLQKDGSIQVDSDECCNLYHQKS